jgi:hypothetical protein
LKAHQIGELVGIVFLLAATATQIFYLDPLKRQIEWRLATFSIQQTAELQTDTLYANHIDVLRALNASADKIAAAEKARRDANDKFATANANVANYLIAKEPVEDIIQVIALALFALGSLLAGIGRALELRSHGLT